MTEWELDEEDERNWQRQIEKDAKREATRLERKQAATSLLGSFRGFVQLAISQVRTILHAVDSVLRRMTGEDRFMLIFAHVLMVVAMLVCAGIVLALAYTIVY